MPNKSYNRIVDEHLYILVAQGNHEACDELRRRYHRYARKLCSEILAQYTHTGFTFSELLMISDNYFHTVLIKFDPSLYSSFYLFWRTLTTQELMDYFMDNSLLLEEDGVNFLSLDELEEDKRFSIDALHEKDEDRKKQVVVFELNNVINKNKACFSSQELMLLKLALEGYTIKDLERSGLLQKSQLYLTFNNAIDKLKNLIHHAPKNKR